MTESLTVVIAVAEGSPSVEPCLAAHLVEMGSDDVLVVVADRKVELGSLLADPRVVVHRVSGSPLVPHLWGEGIRIARSPWVRTTIPSFIPEVGWRGVATPLRKLETVGISGPVVAAHDLRRCDAALYCLRYRRYDPAVCSSGSTSDIPADHATYEAASLRSAKPATDGGFWERPVNRELTSRGLKLAFLPEYRATYRGGEAPWQFFRQRYRHGREFGAALVTGRPGMRIARGAVFLLPMAVFLLRIVRECARSGGLRRALSRGFGWLLIFLFAWSFGEWVGVVFGPPRDRAMAREG